MPTTDLSVIYTVMAASMPAIDFSDTYFWAPSSSSSFVDRRLSVTVSAVL